ncbi:MAG: tRNA (adenosine(37)-N6)-threonylcarbamoyltransferase complex dimerization subunit type 1 TsaB [Acidimicrobiales bacterium]
MLILGIESATTQVGCAIGGHEGILASALSARDRRHAESLAPQIDFVRRQAGIELTDLGAVAVDVGPGLYTGLRVGITTAITLAHALGIPMVGVPSLDLVAFPLRFSDRQVVVAIDARRGEVFHSRYRPVPGGVQRVSEPSVGPPEEVASEIVASGEEVLLVGDGAERHATAFDGIGEIDLVDRGFAHPSAAALVELAHARALREEFVRPDQIEPLYLRRPDAQARWSEAVGRGR